MLACNGVVIIAIDDIIIISHIMSNDAIEPTKNGLGCAYFSNVHASIGKAQNYIKSLPYDKERQIITQFTCMHIQSLLMLYSISGLAKYPSITRVVFNSHFSIKTPFATIKDHELVFEVVNMIVIQVPHNQSIHTLVSFKQLFPNCKTLVLDVDFRCVSNYITDTHEHDMQPHLETETFDCVKSTTATRLVLTGDMHIWPNKCKLIQVIARALSDCPSITSLVFLHVAKNIYRYEYPKPKLLPYIYLKDVVFANPLTLYLHDVRLNVASDVLGIKSVVLLHGGAFTVDGRSSDLSNPNWFNLD